MKKKILAGVISAALMFGAVPLANHAGINSGLSGYPVSAEETKVLYTNDFEDGEIGKFVPRMNEDDAVKLEIVEDGGSKVLECSGRDQSWQGISLPAEGLMEIGQEYSVTASVKAQWYAEVCLSIQYDDSSGETHYVNVKKAVSQGDWVTFEDARVSFPDGTENCSLYFEGGDSNLYLDNFTLGEPPELPIEEDIKSLKAAYADYFRFGTAATASELSNKTAQKLIKKHFNSLTPGNELKPESVLNQAACQAEGDNVNPIVSIGAARSILNFCRDNNIPVRGHTLVWHSQTPGWFFKEGFKDDGEWVSKDIMLQRMENYIKNIMEAIEKEYPTVNFYAWDVVNEAWTDDGKPREGGEYDWSKNQTDKSGWTQVFGDNSFIDYAFEYARKYAPEGCKLYYNDYNEYMSGKQNAIIEMATRLKEKGVIDGIGMQSHLDVRMGSDAFPSIEMYEAALAKYCETGLDVQVTELDATLHENSADEANFKKQADYYKGILDACKKHKDSISAVVVWGTTDDKSWRASQNPLLFNGDFTAKPAYYSIVEGMEAGEDPTEPTIETKPTTESTTETTKKHTDDTTKPSKPTTSDSTSTSTTINTDITGTTPKTTKPTETTTIDPDLGFIPGDANDDGKVDVFDAVKLRKELVSRNDKGFLIPPDINILTASAMDVSGDGMILVNDLILLSRYITGADVELKYYTGLIELPIDPVITIGPPIPYDPVITIPSDTVISLPIDPIYTVTRQTKTTVIKE